jgi:hypothetical protein
MTFKILDPKRDKTTTRTLLHEQIPLTGTIISGTYGAPSVAANWKTYSHGMFQSIYDYPYLSSSANHIFDITAGYTATSEFSASTSTQNSKKINISTNLVGTLEGYTTGGVLKLPEADLNIDLTGTMDSYFILPISRLLTKDQMKLGTFVMAVGTGSYANPFDTPSFSTSASLMYLVAASGNAGIAAGSRPCAVGHAEVIYRRYGPEGSYTYSGLTATNDRGCGVVYNQAGVVLLTSSLFAGMADFISPANGNTSGLPFMGVSGALTGTTLNNIGDSLMHRIYNISFQNTTEISSVIYFCRANSNEFNFSTNPTYLTASKMRVKTEAADPQLSFITTVGLYSADNQLMAVAKLSEPLRKDPTNEITLRVRLDY